MKNTLIRGFVVVLALAGFGGSTVLSNASVTAKAKVSVSSLPPMCSPKDPTTCQVD